MAMSAGAPCTALRDVFEPACPAPSRGRVVHVCDRSVAIRVGSGRLVVLDARPGPDSLPCSVLTPASRLPDGSGAAGVGERVELSAAGLRAAGWAVRLVRWWSPACVPTGGARDAAFAGRGGALELPQPWGAALPLAV